jgi:hypothetical protein
MGTRTLYLSPSIGEEDCRNRSIGGSGVGWLLAREGSMAAGFKGMVVGGNFVLEATQFNRASFLFKILMHNSPACLRKNILLCYLAYLY